MKLTKRMKNAIIQTMLAQIIFLFLLGGVMLLFVIPRVQESFGLKVSLEETYASYNTVQKEGISYQEIRQIAAQENIGGDLYTTTLLRNVTPQFYNQIFGANINSEVYEDFLKEVQKKVLDEKSSEAYIEKDKTLGAILPIYTQDSKISEEGLTDFAFINYIENLLYSFNLSADGEIGVGDLVKVGQEESVGGEKALNTLQEEIFEIPLQFDLTGQKSDIVDFIHFFENVGSISINEKNLEIYSDKFTSKTIEGDSTPQSLYNIYKKQIADISSLDWQDYPDSSTHTTSKGLISLMKSDQAREKVSIGIELNFYVAGIPGYRMEKYITDLISDFTTLSQELSSEAKKYTTQSYKFNKGSQLQAISQLQNLDMLMLAQAQDIQTLEADLAKQEDIQKTYDAAIKQRNMFEWIEKSYKAQKDILDKEI